MNEWNIVVMYVKKQLRLNLKVNISKDFLIKTSMNVYEYNTLYKIPIFWYGWNI